MARLVISHVVPNSNLPIFLGDSPRVVVVVEYHASRTETGLSGCFYGTLELSSTLFW